MRFRLGTSPPRETVGCATFPFRVGFASCLAPPATMVACGRVLTVVGLAIAPFSSRPPRHTGGTRQVLTDGLPYSVYVTFNYLLRVFPGFIARPFRGVGEWVLRSRIFDSCSS